MSDNPALLPVSSYALVVRPGQQTPAIGSDYPISVRLTIAALDVLNPVDKKNKPSVLRMIRYPSTEGLSSSDEESDDSSEDEEMDEEDEEQARRSRRSRKQDESEQENEDGDEDEEEDEEEVSFTSVVCTLSPESQFQQSLDIVLTPHENVAFEVVGSYPVHLSGNYIDHPFDYEDSDGDSADSDENSDEDSDEDSEEDVDLDALLVEQEDSNSASDSDEEAGARIWEHKEDEQPSKPKEAVPKLVKDSNQKSVGSQQPKKRTNDEPASAVKKAKKGEEKRVEFSESLEKGPEATESKYPTKKLEGGVVIEDRKTGEGPKARPGQKVGMRYIGKLKNGSVFDKNTSGKPFYFTLGRGEVIKGWDVGVANMSVKGERRIIIPPAMAYGKKALPGIPANSELIFDVKLVSIK